MLSTYLILVRMSVGVRVLMVIAYFPRRDYFNMVEEKYTADGGRYFTAIL